MSLDSKLISLIRTIGDPDGSKSETAPEINKSNASALSQDVQFSCSFEIAPVVPYPAINVLGIGSEPLIEQTDTVFNNTGLYISFPQRSVRSRYHMGIVRAGGAVRKPRSVLTFWDAGIPGWRVGSEVRGLALGRRIITGPDARGALNVTPTFQQQIEKAFAFEWVSELALPRVGTNNAIHISPSLEDEFSKVREVAGIMTLRSSTISGANFNLSGTFTAGVVADTRDLCVVGSEAYPASSIVTQSTTQGTTLKASPVILGAVETTGPDFPRQWAAPDVDVTDRLNGEFLAVEADAAMNPLGYQIALDTGVATVADEIIPCDFGQVWVTPYDTRFWVTQNAGNAGLRLGSHTSTAGMHYQVIRTPAINECGVLDVKARLQYKWLNIPLTTAAEHVGVEICCSFTHMFCYIDEQGHVQYNPEADSVTRTVSSLDHNWSLSTYGAETPGPDQVPEAAMVFESSPRMYRSAFAGAPGGKYVGTLVNFTIKVVDYTAVSAPGNTVTFLSSGLTMYVRARSVDADGEVGVAHIVRYDQLSEGQTLQMQGMARVQAIAKGSLQPYLKRAIGDMNMPSHVFNQLIDELYNRSPDFLRITTWDNYNNRIIPFLRKLDRDKLIQIVEEDFPGDNATMIKAIGQASGLLGGFGALAGHLIDQATGNKEGLGAQIGNTIGSMGDSFLPGGASGLYHSPGGQFLSDGRHRFQAMGGARGQFGAGMGGYAAGQFGAGRRGREDD